MGPPTASPWTPARSSAASGEPAGAALSTTPEASSCSARCSQRSPLPVGASWPTTAAATHARSRRSRSAAWSPPLRPRPIPAPASRWSTSWPGTPRAASATRSAAVGTTPRSYGYLYIRYGGDGGHGDALNDALFSAEIAYTLEHGVHGGPSGGTWRYSVEYSDAGKACTNAWGFRVVLARQPMLADGHPTGIITALRYSDRPTTGCGCSDTWASRPLGTARTTN